MFVLFAVAALVTPAEHYDRALLISIFTVQLTQIFFGWTATLVNLFLIGVGYTSLIALGADSGAITSPAEELWTLALYGIGVVVYLGLQGQVTSRMNALVQIFSKAQEGDFSARYEEPPDAMPDPVSIIGRAYNRMRSHLETIVLTDPLSGCFNRRGLNQLAEREVARAIRQKKEIAVLAIDVDHFKRINDEFGHLTGDEVIREVGFLLRETAREADIVARFGGEEFTILAPESGDEGALILAERVMDAFRNHKFRSLPPHMKITTSVGVAADLARDDEIAKTLLARADEALYVAKRNGRDCAVLWHAGMRAFDGSISMAGRGRPSVPGMLRINE
jgi:diguanylate cyclase (GGDEF)-like protein